jgi:hypothetical protein
MTGIAEWQGFLQAQTAAGLDQLSAAVLLTWPLLLVVPLVLAAASRDAWTAVAVLLLAAAAYAVASGVPASPRGIGAAAAFVVAIIVALTGFRARSRRDEIQDLAVKIDRIETQLRTFLKALDERAHLVDQRAQTASTELVQAKRLRAESVGVAEVVARTSNER